MTSHVQRTLNRRAQREIALDQLDEACTRQRFDMAQYWVRLMWKLGLDSGLAIPYDDPRNDAYVYGIAGGANFDG